MMMGWRKVGGKVRPGMWGKGSKRSGDSSNGNNTRAEQNNAFSSDELTLLSAGTNLASSFQSSV